MVKKLIITSSKDKVNANNTPDITPGHITGKVTFKKVFNLLAPKSIAASSMDLSNPLSLDLTVITTKGMLNVAWASTKENKPKSIFKSEKNESNEIPKTISGITTGTYNKLSITLFP